MIRLTFLACAAIVAFSLACGGKSSTSSTPSPEPTATAGPSTTACTPLRPTAPGETTVSISSGGADRTYILHVPKGYSGATQTPLVMLFHGYAMGAQLMMAVTEFGALSDTEGFIVASLQGTGDPPNWGGIPPVPGPSDLPFVKDVVAKLKADLCIDPDRVFAAGYSNGGGMAQLLACEMNDEIAAVGIVSGLYTNCAQHAPVIAFHGTADPVLPFDGGDIAASPAQDNTPPVRRSVSEWAVALGCDGLATISHATTNVELSTFHNCRAGDGEALLYTVIGGGHTWPGATIELPVDLVGTTTHDISATSLIWQFFMTHSLVH